MAVAVEVAGLREVAKLLRAADPAKARELTRIHREIAALVADRARAAAPARLRSAIRPRATHRVARIDTAARPGDALARIWGTKRRSGWYAAPRYRRSAGRQHPAWVGNQWEPGAQNSYGSPYYIGPAIDASVTEVETILSEGLLRVIADAFPTGGS